VKKRESRSGFWIYAIAAVIFLYFAPLVLLIADFASGNFWFASNAPKPLKDAVEVVYSPVELLVNWLMPMKID
jgi:hypothetical protein